MKGLRVPIQDIPQEGLTVTFGEKSSHLELEGEDSSWGSPVKGSCLLQRFDSEVLCRGKLQATLIMECGRCLRTFHHPLEVGFTVTFQPKVSPPTEEELELEAQDFDTYSYETGEIDLKETIRDHLGSAVPLQPLCRTDCAGLCPRCGRDLNEGLCHCPPQEGDLRWAALTRLKGGAPPRREMPLPKRKTSKARRDKRRANWKIPAPAMSVCPKCRTVKLPHRVCPRCGSYHGREVLAPKEA